MAADAPVAPATYVPPASGKTRDRVKGRDVALGIGAFLGGLVVFFALGVTLPRYFYAPFLFPAFALAFLGSAGALIAFAIKRQRPGIIVGMGIAFGLSILLVATCAFLVIRALGG